MTDSERTVHGDDEIDLNDDDDDFDTSSSPSEMVNDGQTINHVVPSGRPDIQSYGNHVVSNSRGDGTNGGTPSDLHSSSQNEELSGVDRNSVS
jgi:hypothetical protein